MKCQNKFQRNSKILNWLKLLCILVQVTKNIFCIIWKIPSPFFIILHQPNFEGHYHSPPQRLEKN